MITVGRLIDWLEMFDVDAKVAIDEGGLTLEVKDADMCLEDDEAVDFFEIGGWPQDLDELDDEL